MLFNSYLQYLHISGYEPKRVLYGYIDIHCQNNRNFFFSHSVKNFASRLTRKMDFVDWFDFDPLSVVCTYVYVKLCTYHDLYGITLVFTHTCEYYQTRLDLDIYTFR